MSAPRTPQQIIGDDAYVQLAFEGYEVVTAETVASTQAEILRLKAALAPFARVAPLVEKTDVRDREIVARWGKPDGGHDALVREDFRRAARSLDGEEGA